MSTVTVTAEAFDDLIAKNSMVVLDFWAAWCGPCRRFAPIFEASATKHADVVHGKVDTEAEQALAAAFGIQSIPTTIFFKDQVMVGQQPGLLPPEGLESMLEQLRALDMVKVKEEIAKRRAEDPSAG